MKVAIIKGFRTFRRNMDVNSKRGSNERENTLIVGYNGS
jgi:hypothetical protein